jgi:MerR family transcriptional regulator, copper efflux regulator
MVLYRSTIVHIFLFSGRIDMDTITIGEVARRAGVCVETIRYYEREGIIQEPDRTESGYRKFPPDTVTRLA